MLPNFRPTTTRFEGQPRYRECRASTWTSHATSLHEVLNEETDTVSRFRRLRRNVLVNRDTNCGGEAKMQCRDAVESARILVVASD